VTFVRRFVVGDDQPRLDRFLERELEGVSRLRIRYAIRDGRVTINGEHRTAGRRLRGGDLIEVRLPEEPVVAMRPEPLPLTVIYEDDDLLVVDKPAGMLVHPTARVHSGTLLNAVAHYLASRGGPERPTLVHRLDRATSGVLVVARSRRAHALLAHDFHERRVEKTYLALVCGVVEGEGCIDVPIGHDQFATPRYSVRSDGRPAQSYYRGVSKVGPYSLVELVPVTGRTNQLRIHMAWLGAPIAGDELHGGGRLAEFRRHNPGVPAPRRLLLHALRLRLTHPSTGELVEFEAPLPADWPTQ
jgi:23S rRNA pseudouridine1911/1915/1917 synthase